MLNEPERYINSGRYLRNIDDHVVSIHEFADEFYLEDGTPINDIEKNGWYTKPIATNYLQSEEG